MLIARHIKDTQNNLYQYPLIKEELVKGIAKQKITFPKDHSLYPLYILSLTLFFACVLLKVHSCLLVLWNVPLLNNQDFTVLIAASCRITFPFSSNVTPQFFLFWDAPAHSCPPVYTASQHVMFSAAAWLYYWRSPLYSLEPHSLSHRSTFTELNCVPYVALTHSELTAFSLWTVPAFAPRQHLSVCVRLP